jgi:formylmethanofuran dehydrogenase subunit C
MKKSKGNLLITFILLMALSVTVFSYLYLIGFRLKESGLRVSENQAFYAAEAGLNKAIWYLATPIAQGGKGISWRVTSSHEVFGRGKYYMTVRDAATGEVLVISTGEVLGLRKTVTQSLIAGGGAPTAFSYSLFSNSASTISGSAIVRGDMYVNGNTILTDYVHVEDGYLYHPTGTTVTIGSGYPTYTDGGQPDPKPVFPTLDTSFYDGQISIAQGVAAGNVTYTDATVNLNGSTVYVKGNVTIAGNTTFNGPGAVVATGKISLSGNTYSTGSVKFISNGALNATGNTYTDGSTYYSSTSILATGNTRVSVGSFITKGDVTLGGNLNMSGIVYAQGSANLYENVIITGSLVTNSVSSISGNAHITYDPAYIPAEIPVGFSGTSLIVKKGTWKGN